jgi:hypothetical protein
LNREDRLGVFVPFMQAYGRADAATREALEQVRVNYAAGWITATTFRQRVAALLGVT